MIHQGRELLVVHHIEYSGLTTFKVPLNEPQPEAVADDVERWVTGAH